MKATIIHIVTREEIEACDIRPFLEAFAPIHGRPRFPMGEIHLLVSGYDDQPDELYLIPEVREYFQFLHSQWRGWLYYFELETASLRMAFLCQCDHLQTVAVRGAENVQIGYRLAELVAFIDGSIEELGHLSDAASESDEAFERRFDEVMRYFGLPDRTPQ